MANSTTLRASNRSVQFAYPFGGSPRRSAITRASRFPSSNLGVVGSTRFTLLSVSSKPRSTNY